MVTQAFMQMCQASPPHKPCMTLCVICFGFRRVSLAEYIRVLRVYPTMLQVEFSACEDGG